MYKRLINRFNIEYMAPTSGVVLTQELSVARFDAFESLTDAEKRMSVPYLARLVHSKISMRYGAAWIVKQTIDHKCLVKEDIEHAFLGADKAYTTAITAANACEAAKDKDTDAWQDLNTNSLKLQIAASHDRYMALYMTLEKAFDDIHKS
jgi:hypothetical protein